MSNLVFPIDNIVETLENLPGLKDYKGYGLRKKPMDDRRLSRFGVTRTTDE
jgi:hypothetical protein